jgi:hypothetical protein
LDVICFSLHDGGLLFHAGQGWFWHDSGCRRTFL